MANLPGTWTTEKDAQGREIRKATMLLEIEGIKKNCCIANLTIGNAKNGGVAILFQYAPGGNAYHADYANVRLVKQFDNLEAAINGFGAAADEFGRYVAERTTQAGYRTRAYAGHDTPVAR